MSGNGTDTGYLFFVTDPAVVIVICVQYRYHSGYVITCVYIHVHVLYPQLYVTLNHSILDHWMYIWESFQKLDDLNINLIPLDHPTKLDYLVNAVYSATLAKV